MQAEDNFWIRGCFPFFFKIERCQSMGLDHGDLSTHPSLTGANSGGNKHYRYMATIIWLSLYGNRYMATIIWLSLYGNRYMAIVIWKPLYGYRYMEFQTVIWLSLYGISNRYMAIVIWNFKPLFGYRYMAEALSIRGTKHQIIKQ